MKNRAIQPVAVALCLTLFFWQLASMLLDTAMDYGRPPDSRNVLYCPFLPRRQTGHSGCHHVRPGRFTLRAFKIRFQHLLV